MRWRFGLFFYYFMDLYVDGKHKQLPLYVNLFSGCSCGESKVWVLKLLDFLNLKIKKIIIKF